MELLSDSELMLSNDRLCRCRQSKLREEREKQEIFVNLFDVGEGKKTVNLFSSLSSSFYSNCYGSHNSHRSFP